MNTYLDFQNAASSEKVTLVILDGSKRLFAFSNHSGFVYRLQYKNPQVITSLKVKGEPLTSVSTLLDMEAGTYFNDPESSTLYVWLPNDENPNQTFVVCTTKYFFSNRAVTLPWDLNDGFEIYFEPMVKSTSAFGVELDVVNQATSAIEGDGSVTFYNDSNFWPKNYDKITFENQNCEIYSWNPKLQVSEAKLLFKGFIDSKTYSNAEVTLSLKDLLYQLRGTVNLQDIQNLELRNDPSLDTAKQRIVYGAVKGHRPVNLDKTLNGSYPITGTISAFFNETSIIGTSTKFKKELSINDKILIQGVQNTVAKILSDTALEVTSPYASVTLGGISAEVIPATNKNYINRQWLLAGHPLSQPIRSIQVGTTTQRLFLDSTEDFYDGDDLYIGEPGSGELVRIDKVINGQIVTLAQSTETIYPANTPVHRPCVQNLRMNDIELVYLEDYTVDPNSALLSISEDAESNRAPLLESAERITVTNGEDTFYGVGTKFLSYIKPGFKVKPQSTDDFYTVLEVTDTTIKLTEPYTGPTFTTATALPEKTGISGLAHYKERYAFRAVPDTNLSGKYFKIWDSEGSVAVWFDINNSGAVEPDHGCDRGIEITTIKTGDNQFTILKKIAQKLNLDSQFTCTILGDVMSIENKVMGARPASKTISDDGLNVLSLSKSEQRVTCVADVADSLDEKFFVIHDSAGSVAFWIATNNNLGAIEPNHGCDRSVKVTTVNTDDNAATVRNKLKAAVEADSGFTTVDYGSVSFIAQCSMVGPSVGTLPAGFQISIEQSGKSAWDLNGKYFVLPHHYTGTDRTAGFWFDIDNVGTSAPVTGATANTEINSITAGMTEEEIFEAISGSIDAHPNFTSEYSADSILVTDEANENVSTQLNAGTSGFNIVQIQAGMTSNPSAGRLLQYKSFIFGDNDVLSCDLYGKTIDGQPTSRLLKVAPEIVRDLVITAGLGASLNEDNFLSAKQLFTEELSFCIPQTFNDKASKLTYRDVINDINNSVFGMLLQSTDFKLEYAKLRPRAEAGMPYYSESDILSYKTESTNKNMIKEAIVEYGFKEFDYITKGSLNQSTSKSSDIANYVLGTNKSRTFNSLCSKKADAKRLADRWSFLLEYSSNSVTFSTKLIASRLQVNDVIQIEHRKLYERLGGIGTTKLVVVERIAKKGDGVEITAIDLSNAFNRVAKICTTQTNYQNSNDQTKLISGFYTDQFGLINSDEDSFYINKIW